MSGHFDFSGGHGSVHVDNNHASAGINASNDHGSIGGSFDHNFHGGGNSVGVNGSWNVGHDTTIGANVGHGPSGNYGGIDITTHW